MGKVLEFSKKHLIDTDYNGAVGIACCFKPVNEEYTLAKVHCRVTNERPIMIEIYVEDPSDVPLKDIRDRAHTHGEVIFYVGARDITHMHMYFVPGQIGIFQCMLTKHLKMAKDLYQILGWEGQPTKSWYWYTA